ncbi:MAG: pssE [Devosia sp.]|nr:pssE [Devosia sp.]
MILVTVGTQLPFDRLIAAMDALAPRLGEPVFAQVGLSPYQPKNIEWARNLAPAEFAERFAQASTIVAHAGIGTVLTAQRWRKPIILVPRRASLGEHRNEHQLATCAQLKGKRGIYVAEEVSELEDLLNRPLLSASAEDDQGSRQQFTAALSAQLSKWSRD